MNSTTGQYWDHIYNEKGDQETSWFQPSPAVSLELIARAPVSASVIDIGGGTSRLVDGLLAEGRHDVTVLDVSDQALQHSRDRLGADAGLATWVAADVTAWKPDRNFDVWHDRAVFHFLTDPRDQTAYRDVMHAVLAPGSLAIIGTFAEDGPTHCSGLPVARYDADALLAELGDALEPVEHRRQVHTTPWNTVQPFTWLVARRR